MRSPNGRQGTAGALAKKTPAEPRSEKMHGFLTATHRPRQRHRGHRRRPVRLLYRRDLTNDEVSRLIAEIGADRLLAALDRWTRPRLTAAE
jgi:hypothetical protein